MARSHRCCLALGHEDGHVWPTHKPIGDRLTDPEFRDRTLSVPGVTVPGNVPRCKGRKRYVYEVEIGIGGQKVRIERSERFVALINSAKPYGEMEWKIVRVSETLEHLQHLWGGTIGELEQYRVFDQKYGHIWMPVIELDRRFLSGDCVYEVKP